MASPTAVYDVALTVNARSHDTGPALKYLLSPEGVERGRLDWPYVVTVGLYHAIALTALLPWLFSWTGVGLMVAGIYVFGSLGINLCYHRLLTHRGLSCPVWVEHSLAILGVCCMQDTPARWVAVHRRHHQYSDERDDPHSPHVNLFWGHMGWMLVRNRDLGRQEIYARFAKDILRDPFYKRLETSALYPTIIVGSWFAFFAAGYLAALLAGQGASHAVQFGLSLLIWGVFVRTVLVWHITWSVNSIAHRWGYRNYDTADRSRNNGIVALLAAGEGWHNNHHADPRSASHGHRWWEFDLTFLIVRGMEKAGLATSVVRPRCWGIEPASIVGSTGD